MALIPLIQPPIMKLLTTKEMRKVKMTQLRTVSKTEKIIFPIVVTIFVILLVPDTAPLIGMLMLGNLFRECGVCDRLSDTAQNALMNIVTIALGLSVGFKATYDSFLTVQDPANYLPGPVRVLPVYRRRRHLWRCHVLCHWRQGEPPYRLRRRVPPSPWPPACLYTYIY